MDVLEAVKGRRSMRAFKNRDVPAEIVEKLIDAARWAPSAGNIQPWEFIARAPAEVPTAPSRRPISQIVHYETF